MGAESYFAPSVKIIESVRKELPDGFEQHFTVELTFAQGPAQRIKSSYRKVTSGDSYAAVARMDFGRGAPVTVVAFGQQGTAEGDHRIDKVATVTMHADGTVRFMPPRECKVWLKSPDADLAPEEAYRFLQDFHEGRASEFICIPNA